LAFLCTEENPLSEANSKQDKIVREMGEASVRSRSLLGFFQRKNRVAILLPQARLRALRPRSGEASGGWK